MKKIILIALLSMASSLASAKQAEFIWGVPVAECKSTTDLPFEMTIYASMVNPFSSAMIALKSGPFLSLLQVSVTANEQSNQAVYLTPSVAGSKPSKLILDMASGSGVWSEADGINAVQVKCTQLPLKLPTP